MNTKKFNPWFRVIAFTVILTFTGTSIIPPAQVYAQSTPSGMVTLPPPGALLNLSPAHTPSLLSGIQLNLDNPFQFEFLVQKGDDQLTDEQKQQEYDRLIKYFLTVLTVPDKELWVNLSPYEKNRIVSDDLGKTAMGRDLLALDYILKQLTASLMYPEGEAGKEFWKRVYAKAQEKFGTTEIPVNTFNRVWIIPQTAVVLERNNTAFIVESRLKVLLEQDLMAMDKQLGNDKEYSKFSSDAKNFAEIQKEHNKDVNQLSAVIVRDVILPEIEKEVNEGKSFAQLRQIYNAMILAVWFKKRLQQSVFGDMYLNQKKMDGISLDNNLYKQEIYAQYVEAYKKGAYNFIKEEYDATSEEMIPRKYFSGGVDLAMLSKREDVFRLLSETGVDDNVRQALSRIFERGIESVPVDASPRLRSNVQSVQYGNITMEYGELELLRSLGGTVAADRINQQVDALIGEGADVTTLSRLKSLFLMFTLNTKRNLSPEYLAALEENVRWIGAIQAVDNESLRIQSLAVPETAPEAVVVREVKELIRERKGARVLQNVGVSLAQIITAARQLVTSDSIYGRQYPELTRQTSLVFTEPKRAEIVWSMIKDAPVEVKSQVSPLWEDGLKAAAFVAMVVLIVSLMIDSQNRYDAQRARRYAEISSVGSTPLGSSSSSASVNNLNAIEKLMLLKNIESLEFKGARDRLEKAQAELKSVQARLKNASQVFDSTMKQLADKPQSKELLEKSKQTQKEFKEAQLAVRAAEKEEREAEVALLTAEQNRQNRIVLNIGLGLGLTTERLEQAMRDWREQKRERSTFGNRLLDEALKQIGELEAAIEVAKKEVSEAEVAINDLARALGKTPTPVRENKYQLQTGENWQVLEIDPKKSLAKNIEDYFSDQGIGIGHTRPNVLKQVMQDNDLKQGDPMPQKIFMRPLVDEEDQYGSRVSRIFTYRYQTPSVFEPKAHELWNEWKDRMFSRLPEQRREVGKIEVFVGTKIVTQSGTLDETRELKWVPVPVQPGQTIRDVVKGYFGRPIDGVTEGYASAEERVLEDNYIFDRSAPLPKVIWMRPIARAYDIFRSDFRLSRIYFYLAQTVGEQERRNPSPNLAETNPHYLRMITWWNVPGGEEIFRDILLEQQKQFDRTGKLDTSIEEQEKVPVKDRAMNSDVGGIALDSAYLNMEIQGEPISLNTPVELQWMDSDVIGGLNISTLKAQTVVNPWALPIFSGMQAQ